MDNSLNVRVKTVKHLEKKREENLYVLGLSEEFLV